jgi:hypothetical protein
MVRHSGRLVRKEISVVSRASSFALAAIVVLAAGADIAQGARQVTLTAVADSGLYGDSGSGRANRGAGGRFDIGPMQNVLIKFDLSGVLSAQEVIQSAILQLKEAKGDRYSYGMHVYAYPFAVAWQEGIGTTGGVSGSTGFPWGPASIGDAVYLYSQTTQVGLAEQYPELASAGWTGYIVATNGVAWTLPGG